MPALWKHSKPTECRPVLGRGSWGGTESCHACEGGDRQAVDGLGVHTGKANAGGLNSGVARLAYMAKYCHAEVTTTHMH